MEKKTDFAHSIFHIIYNTLLMELYSLLKLENLTFVLQMLFKVQ